MESLADMSSLLTRAIQEFASVPHPGNSITLPNCCGDHEAWNEWCSCHSSEEFFEALSKDDFDAFEFGSLFPSAFHYFSGAVLRYCLDQLGRGASVVERWADWVHVFCPPKEGQEEFMVQYASRFTAGQRAIVAELLTSYAERYFEEEGLQDEECKRAVRLIWGTSQCPSGSGCTST